MTTTAPAWLNLDAFEIPEAAVADLRRTIAELRARVPQIERLTPRARTAVTPSTRLRPATSPTT